jgi:trk system potassium uptake protein TrkH
VTTGCLIVGGAIVIALLERQLLAADSSAAHRFWAPIFQSITCRTAGFNTINIGALGDATLALMILLMFIGASPGSTGGGIKTTTFALVSAFTFSRMTRRLRVNLFKRSVPDETVARGVVLVLLSLAVIVIVVFMLLIGEAGDGKNDPNAHRPLLSALFETVSAFGTVGLSMGITAGLTAWGKVWIIAMMIIGRVGILTFSYIVVSSSAPKGVEYAEESVMVG